MDFGLGILTFGTLGFVCVFAYLEQRSIAKRRAARRAAATATAATTAAARAA